MKKNYLQYDKKNDIVEILEEMNIVTNTGIRTIAVGTPAKFICKHENDFCEIVFDDINMTYLVREEEIKLIT